MLRGFLRILILKALGEGPKSGYSLMKIIQESTGIKPSPGSVYPLLENLKQEGIVNAKGVGRSKEYKLTPKGKAQLQIIDSKRNECLNNFLSGMRMLSALTGEDMKFPMAMVESMKRGVMPFKEVNPEWDNVRGGLFKMMQQGVLKQKSAKVKKILAKAYQELQTA